MDNNENPSIQADSSAEFNKSDWFLRNLVDICNKSENMYFSITLSVGGILVSGELTGGAQYFNGFADDLAMSGLSSETADLFRRFGEIYTQQKEQEDKEQEDNDGKTNPPPQYIHLRNARIFHPGGNPIPTNRGVWWRGRLEAVDGFILGSLSASR